MLNTPCPNEAEHAKRLYADPVFWLKETCGITATPQQVEFLTAIAYPGAHVAVRSGHGTGKSTAFAAAAAWFLSTRENAKVPCTAPTAHQLEDILWNEIRSLISKMSPWLRSQFVVTKSKVEIKGSSGFIVARTARPENPDALQGFHGENLLFIVDEAAGVHEKVFEVAYGTLSTSRSRVAMAGNPTSLTGFFYKIFHSQNNWYKFTFSCIDSPIVDPMFPEMVAATYGKDSDAYRVRVLGQFPLSGKANIIPYDIAKLALSRSITKEMIENYTPVLGVDPAWEGDDRSVIALRQGPFAKILLAQTKLDGDALSQAVIRHSVASGAGYIFVDPTGVGASCCDFLKMRGIQHIRVKFGGTPDDPDRYFNKRAEIWWRLREWMQGEYTALANYEGLLEDLIAPEYGVKENGKTYMEPKEAMRKRGVRSPDLGDALAVTFYFPYEMTLFKRRNCGVRQNNYVQDYLEEHRKNALGRNYYKKQCYIGA